MCTHECNFLAMYTHECKIIAKCTHNIFKTLLALTRFRDFFSFANLPSTIKNTILQRCLLESKGRCQEHTQGRGVVDYDQQFWGRVNKVQYMEGATLGSDVTLCSYWPLSMFDARLCT